MINRNTKIFRIHRRNEIGTRGIRSSKLPHDLSDTSENYLSHLTMEQRNRITKVNEQAVKFRHFLTK